MNIYKKSLLCVVPIWLVLILIYFLPPCGAFIGIISYFVLPGIVISAMIEGNIHDYNWTYVLIANLILYYFLVLLILYLWRKIRYAHSSKL